MDRYILKIFIKFVAVKHRLDDIRDFLQEDIIDNDVDRFIEYYNESVNVFNYDLFELESRLRALRDKLEHE